MAVLGRFVASLPPVVAVGSEPFPAEFHEKPPGVGGAVAHFFLFPPQLQSSTGLSSHLNEHDRQ
jgi:hypothetical protein